VNKLCPTYLTYTIIAWNELEQVWIASFYLTVDGSMRFNRQKKFADSAQIKEYIKIQHEEAMQYVTFEIRGDE